MGYAGVTAYPVSLALIERRFQGSLALQLSAMEQFVMRSFSGQLIIGAQDAALNLFLQAIADLMAQTTRARMLPLEIAEG